jgi:hypothetical protein
MPEYFTRAQAEALLPSLATCLREMRELRAELAEAERELHDLHARIASNGHTPLEELGALPDRIADLSHRLRERATELAESGAIVKDLEMGLLDFPTLRDDREVYLCWRLGEDHIGWWHEVDAGLAGRQPLEDEEA